MADQGLLSVLRAELAEHLGIAVEDVGPAADLVDELGLTSLDSVALAIRVEERFGCVIEDQAMPALRTLEDVAALLERRGTQVG